MRLRFLCSNHRNWLESDHTAAHDSWLRSYEHATIFLSTDERNHAVNYAGCALETAELLLFNHKQHSEDDVRRFVGSAILLCKSLIHADQHRLVCGVVGGSIARLEELVLDGIQRTAALKGCQELLTVFDNQDAAMPSQYDSLSTLGMQAPSSMTLQ
ncbi:MAG: hypothetical protein AAGF57_08795 [Pseudomonadota bacterium]